MQHAQLHLPQDLFLDFNLMCVGQITSMNDSFIAYCASPNRVIFRAIIFTWEPGGWTVVRKNVSQRCYVEGFVAKLATCDKRGRLVLVSERGQQVTFKFTEFGNGMSVEEEDSLPSSSGAGALALTAMRRGSFVAWPNGRIHGSAEVVQPELNRPANTSPVVALCCSPDKSLFVARADGTVQIADSEVEDDMMVLRTLPAIVAQYRTTLEPLLLVHLRSFQRDDSVVESEDLAMGDPDLFALYDFEALINRHGRRRHGANAGAVDATATSVLARPAADVDRAPAGMRARSQREIIGMPMELSDLPSQIRGSQPSLASSLGVTAEAGATGAVSSQNTSTREHRTLASSLVAESLTEDSSQSGAAHSISASRAAAPPSGAAQPSGLMPGQAIQPEDPTRESPSSRAPVPQSASTAVVPLRVRNVTAMGADRMYLHLLVDQVHLVSYPLARLRRAVPTVPSTSAGGAGNLIVE